ncbi:MAG: RNA polymerase sigma factor [Bacillota bacterium]
MDEAKLVELAKRGHVPAFEQLVKTCEGKVYSIAYRMLGNTEDAKEAAQEAFLRAYVSLKGFEGECSFSTWVCRIVTNLCIDELRRRRRQAPVADSLDAPIQTDDEALPRQVVDRSPGPQELVEQSEIREALQQALLTLSPEHRAVIVLRDVNGMSYEEIAQALELNLGTVKSRLARARQELSRKLAQSELLRTAFVKAGVKGGPASEVR